ncbi:MAG TPA: methyltransferase domain-containing protein [Gammaproteobacteria bacterium]|nr:methyltransferase domain-containing protein [Gammaproteobacteria bacterium]
MKTGTRRPGASACDTFVVATMQVLHGTQRTDVIAPLTQRQLEGELMDDPLLNARAHARALHGLRRINRISRTAATVWRPIAAIARAHPGRTLTVLDIATGGGDLPIALSQRAQRQGVALDVQGCDISGDAVSYARAAAVRADVPVKFFRADALGDGLPTRYDIVTASLFLHHLTDEQVATLLRKLADHADHLVISDLIRSRTGYALAWLGTRLLSRSTIVHVDGLRSVRAAFTVAEARELASQAGLDDAHFARRWPSRFLMTWHRADD